MAFWRINSFRGGLLGLRRLLAFGIVVGVLPFFGFYLLLTPSKKLVTEYTPSRLLQAESDTETQVKTFVTSTALTARTLTVDRKVDHNSSMSFGSLNAHFWSEICGNEVDILRNWPHFPYFPDSRSFVSKFYKTQVPVSKNNGERIFGFVHPRRSGEYKFAITSNDSSELWLSPNEDPASSEMIARVYAPDGSAWTKEGDHKKYPDKISTEITLQAGNKYYIESLRKQGTGLAHVAVYWSYSSSNSPFEIISSEYLSSFSINNDIAVSESIPLHAGKQPGILLQGKRKQYYFNRLPFINRTEYIDLIPTCRYNPSYLVRKQLQRYEGVKLTSESRVFPQDDTDMVQGGDIVLEKKWSTPNPGADKNTVEFVVENFINYLRKYFLKKIYKVIHKPDPKNGDRFLLNLELGLKNTKQSFRLSEHVYLQKDKDALCLPEGMNWNNNATVYFILPVKDQGKWVHYFINQLTEASLSTGDTNFHVIIIDFESKDIYMSKAFNTSLLRSRHTIVSLTGKFYKTLALNKAVEQVPNAHDIVFLFDLHIDVPADIMDSVRMNTIVGQMAYFPVVGRLECESSSVEHKGFWQMNGYGIMSIYKSDWNRFGGMNTEQYKHKWGGEDWDLLDRVLMLPVEVERIKHPGLYHHYHAKQRQWN